MYAQVGQRLELTPAFQVFAKAKQAEQLCFDFGMECVRGSETASSVSKSSKGGYGQQGCVWTQRAARVCMDTKGWSSLSVVCLQ